MKKIINTIKIFQTKPAKGSILELIASSLRLYIFALDIEYDFTCFLGLWQTIEGIVLGERFGGQTKKVIGRLNNFTNIFKFRDFDLSETIKSFSDRRIEITHHGESYVDDIDIGILRGICENAILWLLTNRIRIKTKEELNQLYDSITLGDNILKRNKKIINLILNKLR